MRLLSLSVALATLLSPLAARADPCSDAKLAEIRAPATASKRSVTVNCSVELTASDTITKQLIFAGKAASNVVFDCKGAKIDPGTGVNAGQAMIAVRSTTQWNGDKCIKDPDTDYCTYERPEKVTIRRCDVKGGIFVRGMTSDIVEASRHDDFFEACRAAAPRDITFDDMDIEATGSTAFYVYPGATQVKLTNSSISGDVGPSGTAIYLDAQSGDHLIRGNTIQPSSERELLAIDGSSRNTIDDNYFSSLNHGGIYLYRNCGEAPGNTTKEPGTGTIRHTTPWGNLIINNKFYYNHYTGDKRAVLIGSRNGAGSFCDADLRANGEPYPWGSSKYDYDFAHDNVVVQNQVRKRAWGEMLEWSRRDLNVNNYIGHNETVSEFESRRTGCYVQSAYATNFLEQGEQSDVVRSENGTPTCKTMLCGAKGTLEAVRSCSMRVVNFACRATSNHQGCSGTASCGADRVISARAGCNLEWGSVSSEDVQAIAPGMLEVVRESDSPSAYCSVDDVLVRKKYLTLHGRRDGVAPHEVSFECHENESNGGDCEVRGQLFCR
jgi:parallel beta-helix repeat protein